jgi:glycosyltransferase involved in cell wall biosynthesis
MISIITPTFNSGATITKNVLSIINQSYKDFEHIIVDNASSDDTINKIKALYQKDGLTEKLRIISEKDNGISDAFNKGVRAATGDIITILNSDDEYFDNSVLERVIKAFQNDNILIVHGDVDFIDDVHGSNRRRPLPDKATGGILFNHPTMFIKRQVYDKTGLYDTGFRVSMDYEIFCKISYSFKDVESICAYIQEIPITIMRGGGNSWILEIDSIIEIKKALKLYGYWNFEGKKFYFLRLLRTRVKGLLTALNLNFLLKLWRRLKWKN